MVSKKMSEKLSYTPRGDRVIVSLLGCWGLLVLVPQAALQARSQAFVADAPSRVLSAHRMWKDSTSV
jgi:hypothetical protein